jgi:hypothetical protein
MGRKVYLPGGHYMYRGADRVDVGRRLVDQPVGYGGGDTMDIPPKRLIRRSSRLPRIAPLMIPGLHGGWKPGRGR